MAPSKTIFFISFLGSALSQALNCTIDPSTYNCPTTGSFSYCAGNSLGTNIIVRCSAGCPQPGNCNDNLAGVPPVGVKSGALCYQDSPTAGNGQCTFDCVAVTKADGSSFYPVGCASASASSSASAPPPSSPVSSGSPPPSSSTSSPPFSNSTTSDSPSGGSGPTTTTSTTTGGSGGSSTTTSVPDGAGGTGGSGGSGGEGGVTSSTTYYTTTLPGGSVSTGSSVIAITTSTPPTLSNDANGRDVQGVAILAIAGMMALV